MLRILTNPLQCHPAYALQRVPTGNAESEAGITTSPLSPGVSGQSKDARIASIHLGSGRGCPQDIDLLVTPYIGAQRRCAGTYP
ncbi:hypothetical protein, partial [uncultured Duncaniella sp.]|uniref:hypothetical protein n=1 Tax=uncultured Duncaniella sp. TaxID=2768039 RepID=UPI00261CF110